MKRGSGHQTKHRSLLDGVLRCPSIGKHWQRYNDNTSPLKKALRGGKNRKAPITLATTPFDHRG